MEDKPLNTHESLQVISSMIAKAKGSHHDTGIVSILWGTVIGLCSLATWSQLQFNYKLPFDIWILTFLAVIPTVILSVKENKKRKVKTYDQTAMDAVWICFGVGIFLVVHANNHVFQMVGDLKSMVEAGGQPRPTQSFLEYYAAYMLVLYGIPTIVTASIKNFKPMWVGGTICWISALVVPYTNIKVDMLLMALSAITAWFIPGIILYRKAQVRRKAANV